MAVRKPLVLINGLVQELPDGDTVAAPSVSGSAVLPLVTGDTPGPVLIHDEDGQCVGAPLE